MLQQWQQLADHPNQRFRFERLDDGYYRIRVMHTNRILDVSMGSPDNGAAIVQWDWHGGDNQRFMLEDAGDGYYRSGQTPAGCSMAGGSAATAQ